VASSTEQVITKTIQHIMKLKPKTVLDIGVGFGKWGFLCREYLECWQGRVYPKDWELRIDGIEAWEPFTELPWIKTVYSNLYVGDAVELINTLPDYDLIIANDVIEHVEKVSGLKLLNAIVTKSKNAIVNVPTGKGWMNNKVVDDNPHDKHKAVWGIDEITAAAQIHNKIATCHMWKGLRGDGVLAFYGAENHASYQTQSV